MGTVASERSRGSPAWRGGAFRRLRRGRHADRNHRSGRFARSEAPASDRFEDPSHCKAVLLGPAAASLTLANISADGLQAAKPGFGETSRPAYYRIHLQGAEWSDARLTLEFDWDPTVGMRVPGGGTCLVIPEHLPVVIADHAVRNEPFDLPRVSLAENQAERIRVGGLFFDGKGARLADRSFLQLILVHGGVELVDSPLPIVFTPTADEEASSSAKRELAFAIQEHLDELTVAHGVDAPVHVVLAARRDFRRIRWLPTGACVTDFPVREDDHREWDAAALMNFAMVLSQVWFGGGCKIHGPAAPELEGGLRFAAMLFSSDLRVDEHLVSKVAGWQQPSMRASLRDLTAHARGMIRPWFGRAVGAAIFRGVAGKLKCRTRDQGPGARGLGQVDASEDRRRATGGEWCSFPARSSALSVILFDGNMGATLLGGRTCGTSGCYVWREEATSAQ